MKDPVYLDSVKHHSEIWSEWRENKDLNRIINTAIEDKKNFSNFLKKYIRYLYSKSANSLKILEEGCGTAIDSCLLKREFPYFDFYVIDLSEEAVRLAGKISSLLDAPLELDLQNAASTGFSADYFDMVFSQGLIEHFSNPLNVMLDQYRILKKGGLSIISVPQKYSLFTIFKKVKMRFGKWRHGWEREYTAGELADIGIITGFKILEIDGYGFTIEDFVKNAIRRTSDNRYLSKPLLYIISRIFSVFRLLMGKILRKCFCKNLVAVFKK